MSEAWPTADAAVENWVNGNLSDAVQLLHALDGDILQEAIRRILINNGMNLDEYSRQAKTLFVLAWKAGEEEGRLG